jgi:hypothetical protein
VEVAMGCLGVHFAIDDSTVRKLRSFTTDEDRLDYVVEELEEEFFAHEEQWLAQTDKAWDAIHRSLTDGDIEWDNGTYPLGHVILGGERVYFGDDYVMVLKTPQEVRDVAAALPNVTEESFREGYSHIDGSDYLEKGEDDFGYTWHWFCGLRDFFTRAAGAGRYVLFTADQ